MKKLIILGLVFLIILATPGRADTTTNLVAYYSFDVDATDDTANTNDGAVSGATNTGTGCILNNCYDFDGLNDKITVSDHATIDMGTGDFSLCYWADAQDKGASESVLWKQDTSGSYAGWYSYFLITSGYWLSGLDGADAGDNIENTDATDHTTNGLTFYCAVYDRSDKLHLYVDTVEYGTGVDISSESGDSLDTSTDLFIGTFRTGSTFWFEGTIDEISIYKRALAIDDINELYQGGAGCNPITTNCTITAGDTPALQLNTNIVNNSNVGMIDYPDAVYNFWVNGTITNNSVFYNGSLILNGTINQTFTLWNLSQNNQINYTFADFEGSIEFTVDFYNENASNNVTYILYFDGINPGINSTLVNNSIWYRNNTAEYFNFDYEAGDLNLLAVNATILNATNAVIWQQQNLSISAQYFNYTVDLDLNRNDTGKYSVVIEAWDDHTKQNDIRPVNWVTSPDNIIIDGDITLSGAIKEELTTFILSPDGSKYKFKVTWEVDALNHELDIITGQDLTYFPDSKYMGHFVYWPKKRWIDLVNPNIKSLDVVKLAGNHYKIYIELYTQTDEVEFSSIGDLNYVTTTSFFNISDSFYIEALDSELGTAINTFNVTVYNSTFNQTVTTTTGTAIFNITSGNYTVNVTAADYLAATFNNINFSGGGNYTALLNVTNAFKVFIRDQEDLTLITQWVGLEFIGTNSSNYSTTTGAKYISDLGPDDYIIRYQSAGYSNAFYYFTLENGTNIEFTIYMLSNATTDEVTATVYDEVSNEVEGAFIHVQRYDLNTNSYITVEIIKTNFEGQAVLHLQQNTEFYKFLIYYAGDLKLSTNPTYVYEETITFFISLTSDATADYFTTTEDITSSLNFNPATLNFGFTYSDATNTISQGEIKVYIVNGTDKTLFNSTITASAAATILEQVTNVSGRTYLAEGYITLNGNEYLLQSGYYTFAATTLDADKTGLFYVLILTVLFASLGFWDLTAGVLLAPIPLLITSIIGFIEIPVIVTAPIMILALIIAYLLNKNR